MRLPTFMQRMFTMALSGTLTALSPLALAAPAGGSITAGSGSIQSAGAETTVNQQSSVLSIDWQSLNLASDERLTFNQPGREAVALNHILDQQASEIFGQINANGRVFLMNPNGIVFGETARINVGALVSGAFQLDFAALKQGDAIDEYPLTIGPGAVINNGRISTSDGGSVALLGNTVSNNGSIDARLGKIHLLSADAATLSFDGDGLLQFAVSGETLDNVKQLETAVNNSGQLTAAGGYVVMEARAADKVFRNVVNNDGVIQASRISNEGGVIRLQGSGGNVINSGEILAQGMNGASGGQVSLLGDRVGVLDTASIDVSGDSGGGSIAIGGQRHGGGDHSAEFTQLSAQAQLKADAIDSGNGGDIVLWADDTTWALGQVSARGGANGGNGGFVEISGKQGLVLQADVDLTASNGELGTLLLDPTDITIHDQADGDPQANDGALPTLSNASLGAGSFDIGELALEGLAGTTNLVLEASNNIVLNDLADNVLDFNINNGGSIVIAADTDADGAGSFSMASSDTIRTQGGSLTISGAGVTLGSLDTNGATDGSISITSTASASIGSAIAGSQPIAIAIDSDADGTESLTLTGSLSGSSVTLQGGTNGGDTLIGPNLPNTWTITALNTGTLNGANFSSFPNLTGGSDDDTFTVSGIGSITGVFDGGAHSSGDSVDYSSATGIISVTLNTDVVNIESLIGNGADYSLIADNVANTWTLTSENDGTVGSVAFTDFSNLTGGTSSDDYILSGGSVTGTINGGGGTDSLTANNSANSWNILAADSGNVTSVFAFQNIENLSGGNGADTFLINSGSVTGTIDGGGGTDSLAPDNVANTWNISANDAGTVTGVGDFTSIENLNGRNNTDDFSIADGVSISGTIDGGGGNDSIDLSTQTGAVTVDLSGTKYANIELYTGNGSSSFIADNVPNVWNISGFSDGVNDGTVGLVSFIDFSDISGGSDTDTFTLSAGTLTGTLTGGGGVDTLIADNSSNTWNILTADAGNVTGVGAFSDIDNLTGNAGTDDFVFADGSSLSGVINGSTGADSVDFSAETGAVSVTIGAAGFANIETFIGNNTSSTIIGDNVVNDWSISAANTGTIDTTAFIGFNNISGGSDVDTFTLSGGSISGTIDGGAGSDFLVANNAANTWSITAADAGSLTSVANFSNVENLTGNAAADSFVFANAGSISGIINGATGSDSIDYSAKLGAVSVDLASTNFISIESLIGNNTNSTLLGDNVANTWTITGTNDGTVGVVSFTDFNNLTGSDNSDNFVLNASGSITGALNGGNGTDSIVGVDTGATWNITGADVGNLTAVAGFSAIETLQGGNGIDNFVYANGSSFSGIINGGAGSDIVDLSAQAGAVAIDLSASAFYNIESFIGNGTNSTLSGNNITNTWTISGVDSGDINGINFSGFNNLTGNGQQDQFIVSGGSISGAVDGAGGSDFLQADNGTNTWNILTANSGDVTGINSFSQVENLTGGSGVDAFVFANGASLSGIINGGSGTDLVDLAAEAGTVAITLGSSGYSNIESFIGNNLDSTLTGSATNNTWIISGNNDGSVGGISFTNFNNLVGNISSDVFQFQDGSVITGAIDGGAGLDTVDQSAQSGVVNVLLGATGFSSIETFIGNNTSSTLSGDNIANTWAITGSNSGTIGTVNFTGFNNLLGNNNSDSFSLNGGNISGTVDGGAGSDTIVADNTSNSWTITTADGGNVTGISAFSGIENLTGNTQDDSFVFADGSSISGVVDGATGSDSVDQSAQSGIVTVTLGGSGFTNIESFTGNGGNSTLVGDNIANTWSITGVDSGTVGTVAFSNFSNLQGGTNDDSFVITGGSLSGVANGGAGSDLIQASNGINTWNITGVDVGDVTGINAFANVETLAGNSNSDNYIFADGSSYSGIINGAAGTDSVDYSSETGAVMAALGSGQYQNIENFVGNASNSTLVGANVVNAWTITGADAGTINGINFSDFNNLSGNASADVFTIVSGSISGTIDGGSGNDSIQADDVTNSWTVSATDAGSLTGVNNFQNIDNLLGGNASDTFTINANLSGYVDGATGDDIIALGGIVTVSGGLLGGTGTDTVTGPNQISSWTVSGLDSGSVNGTAFAQIESLNGGSADDTFTFSNAAAAAMSGTINGGAGNDGLVVDYTASSSRSIDFDGGAGTDSISLSGSASNLANSYAFGPATGQVAITTTSSLESQYITGANVETIADNLVASDISISGTSGDDSITLAPGSIAGTQPVSLQIAGLPALQFSNKTNLDIDTGLGNDAISVTGSVAVSGDVSLSAETISEGTVGLLGADTLVFNQATFIGASGNPLSTNVNTLTINGPTVDAYISEANGLALAAGTITGVLDVSTGSGDITSSGSIVATGSSAFSVGNGGSIVLDNAANLFAGTPSFSSTGTINDLSLTDNSSLDLPALTIGGDLNVIASGSIAQAGILNVLGDSSFNAGANAITLNNAANDFVGSVTLQNSGSWNVALNDLNALDIASSSVGSGALSVTAGSIAQSGPLTQQAGAGTTTFTAYSGDIVLTNGGNDLSGTVSLLNTGLGDIRFTESNGLELGSSSTNGGDLSVTASNGITVSGTTTSAGGDITVTANSGDIQLGRLNSGSGRLTINAVIGAVVGDISPITDPNLSSQTLQILAGTTLGDFNNPISVSVPADGTSFFAAGQGSANIIGLTGTVLPGSVLVNDVSATNIAVGKGQSVSFLEHDVTPAQASVFVPLYSIAGGGIHMPLTTDTDTDDERRKKSRRE